MVAQWVLRMASSQEILGSIPAKAASFTTGRAGVSVMGPDETKVMAFPLFS